MSTNLLSIPEDLARQSIAAAVAEGVQASPETAAARVIDRLSVSFGPVIEKIVGLISSGMTELPAILQALQAANIPLPPWVSTVAAILLVVVKPA
jgi:hypothetical protein